MIDFYKKSIEYAIITEYFYVVGEVFFMTRVSQNHNILWLKCALTTNRQLCSAIVPDFGVF